MFKKSIAAVMVMCILLSGQTAYALGISGDISNEISNYKIDIFDEGDNVVGHIVLDWDSMNDPQRKALTGYVEKNGFSGLQNLIQSDLFGIEETKISGENKIILHETTVDVDELDDNDIMLLADGRHSKTERKYKLVTLENSGFPNTTFTCEYYAVVTVTFTKSNNKITTINSTGFNVESMQYQYGYENVRIPTYVANDGSSCGATVNYDVYRWFEIGVDNVSIPFKFVKNCVDSVIAYSSDY